jgi:hypothetical protein
LRIWRIISARRATTSGASPSDGSSRRSTSGFVISVRAIVSICCSPPDSWLPRFFSRSCRRGKRA